MFLGFGQYVANIFLTMCSTTVPTMAELINLEYKSKGSCSYSIILLKFIVRSQHLVHFGPTLA